MNVRPYAVTDLEAVADLFTSAVHGLANAHYDPAQLEAWAPRPPDRNHWQRRLEPLHTLVAEDEKALAGFIAYDQNGHIDLLYVNPSFSRRGVATLLYDHVEAILTGRGVTELITEASVAACPFFERQGFHVIEEQHVNVRGASLRRFVMKKTAAQQGVPRDGSRAARENRA